MIKTIFNCIQCTIHIYIRKLEYDYTLYLYNIFSSNFPESPDLKTRYSVKDELAQIRFDCFQFIRQSILVDWFNGIWSRTIYTSRIGKSDRLGLYQNSIGTILYGLSEVTCFLYFIIFKIHLMSCAMYKLNYLHCFS